jgi:predicted RNase H-like HicB family nuclease
VIVPVHAGKIIGQGLRGAMLDQAGVTVDELRHAQEVVMRTYSVTIEHDQENGTYWARVPALAGCFTQGDSVPEVLEHLQEAMALDLDGLRTDGLPIPDGDAEADEPIRLTVTIAA